MTYIDLFTVADVLNLNIDQDGKLLNGNSSHNVDLGALAISMPMTIVSALASDVSGGLAVICRSIGNLGLLVIPNFSKMTEVSIFILDVAKSPSRLEDVIELKGFKTPQEVVAFLAPGIVKQFHENHDKWTAADFINDAPNHLHSSKS